MYSKDLIKGTLQPIIMKLLSERKRMYGYEITQVVKEVTRGKIEITEGALYPALHKMLDDGLLKTQEELVGGRVRKYYTLTKSGKEEVQARVSEFADFVQTMQVLLKSKPAMP